MTGDGIAQLIAAWEPGMLSVSMAPGPSLRTKSLFASFFSEKEDSSLT
jgi:hypothetical protein